MSAINTPIPVLMYHEVSEECKTRKTNNFQTPIYDMPVDVFDSQIRLLANNGYTSLDFDDILNLPKNDKFVIITFDDGLKGNYQYALPILKKYGFKGVFFVTVGSIDNRPFMTWSELKKLTIEGMSIQSHTYSHLPLQTLSKQRISRELEESKRILEKKLNSKVTAISFPHGSYNKNIISIAEAAGYHTMCSSFPSEIYLKNFIKSPRLIGRIPMTNDMTISKFEKILIYQKIAMLKLKLPKFTKNTLKKIIGINNYRIFYRKYFGIRKQNNLRDNDGKNNE